MKITQQGTEITRQGTVIIQQGTVITQQGNEIVKLKVDNIDFKVKITRQGNEIVKLYDLVTKGKRKRAKRASMEIMSGVQDMNSALRLENNDIFRKQGLSGTLRMLRDRRNNGAHLLINPETKDTLAFKKKALLLILENAQFLEVELKRIGVPSTVTALLSEVLREELLKSEGTTSEISFFEVDYFFISTLESICVNSIEDL
jgi:hypothetical protein